MIKKNKVKIIISSLIILLPMLFGIIMWNKLPEIITTHFGADGKADGFSGKGFFVFGLPAIFLALHLFAIIITLLDKAQRDQTPKALGMIFWIVPIISLFVTAVMYIAAFERTMDLAVLIPIFVGVSFALMGNYMPKVKQNSTLGLKLPWTLGNEENWNKTHRFGGKIMVACGFIIILSALFPLNVSIILLVCLIIASVAVTAIYSYIIYKQHKNDGVEYDPLVKTRSEKVTVLIGTIIGILVLIGVCVLMFTGDIDVTCRDESVKINATYYTDMEIEYSEIDTVSYYKELDLGVKVNGFNSARLLMGIFRNEEFGSYTLYARANAKEFIVLTSGDGTLVIGMSDANETQALYNVISEKIGASARACRALR